MALRKAQAAMEFLMTYGWALIVVLIVIGVLFYSGFVDTSNLLPEKCTFSISVNCLDYSVKEDSITLHLQNVAGRIMIVRNIKVTSEALAGPSDPVPGTCELPPDEQDYLLKKNAKHLFKVGGDPATCAHNEAAGKGKKRYTIELTYSWKDTYNKKGNSLANGDTEDKITHRIKGELLARPPE